MFDSIMIWFQSFDFTGRMGLMLYWLPMIVCAQGYIRRTVAHYRECVIARDSGKYFHSDTLGTLIGRLIATFCPIFNLIVMICDLGPSLLGGFFKLIGKTFDRPLVREIKKD